jgi:hypothetical protein
MNVLDLDVYMDVLYIAYVMCRFCNSSCAGYTVFCKKIIVQAYLLRLEKTVVDKEANLLWPPSRSKLARRGDGRLTYYGSPAIVN